MNELKQVILKIKDCHKRVIEISKIKKRVKKYIKIIHKLEEMTKQESDTEVKKHLICCWGSLIKSTQILNDNILGEKIDGLEERLKEK